MTRRRWSLPAVLGDVLAFVLGYSLLSRWATGGGVVRPDLYFDASTDEARWTVLGSLAAGMLAVLLWRSGLHMTRDLAARTAR
jgi:hypothetical protein